MQAACTPFPVQGHLMDILFIADPLATFKTYKDTTYAMMREAAKRGHKLHHTLAG